jgi:hypothetical protein
MRAVDNLSLRYGSRCRFLHSIAAVTCLKVCIRLPLTRW